MEEKITMKEERQEGGKRGEQEAVKKEEGNEKQNYCCNLQYTMVYCRLQSCSYCSLNFII
jgi:hypothetical protein